MKLVRERTLWVAERRGEGVYTRRGAVGKPGTVKHKVFPSAARAEQFLASELQKRLDEGFVMLDAAASLEDPFTIDGVRPAEPAPRIASHVVDRLRTHVLGGFVATDEWQPVLDDLAELEGNPPGLRGQLDHQLVIERRLARERPRPTPCINDGIDAAFAALDRERQLVALQNAGYTQSDAWSDVNAVAARRRRLGQRVVGGCFYHFQDLERAVRGHGLMIGFGAYADAARDDASHAIGTTIVEVLRGHGVPTTWDGRIEQRIQIDPFEWWHAT